MNINYLSRKFVLSAFIAIVSTLFVWWKICTPEQWLWAIGSTILPYIGANALQEARQLNLSRDKSIPAWNRIAALFDNAFILAMGVSIVASLFLYAGIIPNGIWFIVVSAVGAAYNVSNVVGKLKTTPAKPDEHICIPSCWPEPIVDISSGSSNVVGKLK